MVRSHWRVIIKLDGHLIALAVYRRHQELFRQRFQYCIIQQIFHRRRRRPKAVLKFLANFRALGIAGDAGDALVNSQPQVFAINILRWDADFLSQVECGAAFRGECFALTLGHGAFHHLAVHVETDRFDVTVLFAPQQIPGAAQF